MKRIRLPQDHKEWLEMRTEGIGGSDAGAIAGLNPWKSAFTVYLEKTKQIEPKEIQSEAVRIGVDLEEYVAERFEEETGLKVRKSGYMFQSDTDPFMIANVDRLVCGESAFLECKTTNAFNKDKFSINDIPASHYAQLCHYMNVLDNCTHCYYAVLILGIGFVWIRLEREEMQNDIRELVKIEREFWDNLFNGIPPQIDGSESTTDSISDLYHVSNPEEIADVDENLLEMRDKLIELEKEIKEKKDEIENKIKFQLGEAEKALADGWSVTLKTAVRKGAIDEKLLRENGINADEFRKPEKIYRTLRIKRTEKRGE